MATKFKSERQRRFLWANVPSAAHKWAHGAKTMPSDWGRKGKVSFRKKKRRKR